MKKINLSLALIIALFVSGCVTGAKTVKPSSSKADNSGRPIIMSNEPVKLYSPAGKTPKRAKIQYAQITNLIAELIDIKDNSAVTGESSYSGISENKLTILEIKGNKNDVKEASMKLIYPKGIDNITAELNNAMMSRFLRNAAPEFPDWHGRIKEILDKFYSMKTGIEDVIKEDIVLGNRIIHILYDKNAESIVVTLNPRP